MLVMNLQGFKRSLLWGFLTVITGSAVAKAQTMPGQTLNPIQLGRAGSDNQLAVVKWAAFGSGCRAAEEVPLKERDVQLQILPKNAIQLPQLVFDLSFPDFGLSRGKQLEKDQTLELYAECALRFAIRGQPGRRLRKIEGTARLEIQKDKGAALLIFNELRFGQFGGDEKRLEYEAQAEIKPTRIDLNLAKELAAVRGDGSSTCGTDQVLFYDFTLFAKKPNKASQVNVTIEPPKRASLKLEFENCS